MAKQAYHGGAFFNAIGEDFSKFELSQLIVNADVLDAWFDPSPKALKKIRQYLPYIMKTSPPTHCKGLIKTISKYRKIPKENILVSGGSSDIMFSFFPNLLGKGKKVLILDPMYGEYAHIFQHVLEVELERFKLNKEEDFVVNSDRLLTEIQRLRPDMLVLVNPNSPTGKYLPKKEFIKILKSTPATTLVVIDETYIDYVNPKHSLEVEVKNYKNLVVIKSMSKVYALSGARVGYLVADVEIIDQITQFIPPWPVSMVGQIAGVEALKDIKYYQGKYQETHQLRKQLINGLQKIKGLKIYDSVANYVLVELLDSQVKAGWLVNRLRKQTIFIRDCNSMSSQFENRFIRITVKEAKTNKKIIEAIKKAI